MWFVCFLLILLILLYLWSTCFWRRPTLVPLQPEPIGVNVDDFDEEEIPLDLRQPIFTEPDICTSRDPVFEIRSHSISSGKTE